MKRLVRKIWKNQSGVSAVEYALMIALIAVVIIVAVKALGTTVSGQLEQVETSIE